MESIYGTNRDGIVKIGLRASRTCALQPRLSYAQGDPYRARCYDCKSISISVMNSAFLSVSGGASKTYLQAGHELLMGSHWEIHSLCICFLH